MHRLEAGPVDQRHAIDEGLDAFEAARVAILKIDDVADCRAVVERDFYAHKRARERRKQLRDCVREEFVDGQRQRYLRDHGESGGCVVSNLASLTFFRGSPSTRLPRSESLSGASVTK